MLRQPTIPHHRTRLQLQPRVQPQLPHTQIARNLLRVDISRNLSLHFHPQVHPRRRITLKPLILMIHQCMDRRFRPPRNLTSLSLILLRHNLRKIPTLTLRKSNSMLFQDSLWKTYMSRRSNNMLSRGSLRKTSFLSININNLHRSLPHRKHNNIRQ